MDTGIQTEGFMMGDHHEDCDCEECTSDFSQTSDCSLPTSGPAAKAMIEHYQKVGIMRKAQCEATLS